MTRWFPAILVVVSMGLLAWVDWRIPVGVFLFGWALNIDNALKNPWGM